MTNMSNIMFCTIGLCYTMVLTISTKSLNTTHTTWSNHNQEAIHTIQHLLYNRKTMVQQGVDVTGTGNGTTSVVSRIPRDLGPWNVRRGIRVLIVAGRIRRKTI